MSAACHPFTCSMAPSGWVQELEEPDFHHFFVKKTCTLAMDKHDRCNLCFSMHFQANQPGADAPHQPLRRSFLLLRHAGGCGMDANCWPLDTAV